MEIRDLVDQAGRISMLQGNHSTDKWYDSITGGRSRLILSWLALISSEVGETIIALRANSTTAFVDGLAGIVIAISDICYQLGIDLDKAVANKLEKNIKQFKKEEKKEERYEI